MTSAYPRAWSLIALACLASAAQAESSLTPIRDDAGLFHAASIARAEERIADIRETFDRRLFVRTVASASPRQRRLLPFLRTPEVNRLLEEQARKYADEAGVRGIYVVICKQPRDVHVIVRPNDDPEFTRHDAEALRRMVVRRLDGGGPDTALLALVEQVQSLLHAHAVRGSAVVNEVVLAGVLGGGLVLWGLLGMIRFKMRGGRPVPREEDDAAMQARATPALLGALFGFPAGVWIYDKLYPCPTGSPLPLCEPEPEPALMPEEESRKGTKAEEHPQAEPTENMPVSP